MWLAAGATIVKNDPPAAETYISVVRYDVSILPPDYDGPDERRTWTLSVVDRGIGDINEPGRTWAVADGETFCYGTDGKRDLMRRWADLRGAAMKGWVRTHRFTREEALDLAKRIAPDAGPSWAKASKVLEEWTGGR